MRYVSKPSPGPAGGDQDDANPEQVARAILLRRLNAAPRTESELRGDLLRRGIPEDVADRVLERFAEVGLIDDASYAQQWVEARRRTRGTARAVLRQELRRKGVDDEDVQAALETIDPEDERERARELVRSKARAASRLDPAARMRRFSGMLQRRGYPASVAFGVVREVLAELDGDDPVGDGPEPTWDGPPEDERPADSQ